MNSKKYLPIITVLILISLFITSGQGDVNAGIEEPPREDLLKGLTQPKRYVFVDEKEAMQGIHNPADPGLLSRSGGASFIITYLTAGELDYDNETCLTFPENAKPAFNFATAIWAAKLSSPVPITIKACWANLGDPNLLGYIGGGSLHMNFSGAPNNTTVYAASLANALHGSDLDPANDDMHITFNTSVDWYYGLDGNPGSGKFDLVTVAAHQIAHGLNFSGSASMSGDSGSVGYVFGELRFFNIYDTFMRDHAGNLLSSYTIPSVALGDVLTSSTGLWFHGPNAMAANGSSRVHMYAPDPWVDGSSYSHLAYGTFGASDDNLMVDPIAPNFSQHNTGPVTEGLLKDLGWTAPNYYAYLPMILNGTGVVVPPDTIVNGDFESGHVWWAEYSSHGNELIMEETVPSPHNGTWLVGLGGDHDDSSWISQAAYIPIGRSILHFWYWIDSGEVCGSDYDYFYIDIGSSRQFYWDLCSGNNTYGWVESTLNLTPWAGSSTSVQFGVDTDGSVLSHIYLDDISLEATTRTAEPIFIEGINASSTMRH